MKTLYTQIYSLEVIYTSEKIGKQPVSYCWKFRLSKLWCVNKMDDYMAIKVIIMMIM